MSDRDWAIRTLPRPSAFIQWKGTNVCMDFYCLCGEQFHIDADFTYAVSCPHCDRVYEMSSMIEARELIGDELSGWAENHCTPVRGQL
jgi:hypothetical protein